MIRLLIVDDSKLVCRALSDRLGREPGIEVVGTAADPYEARQRIAELHPDVVTLDIEMPRMDGITFLRKLMGAHPIPVIVVSSYGEDGSTVAVEALELGAVDVVMKASTPAEIEIQAKELATRIRVAAIARVAPTRSGPRAGLRRRLVVGPGPSRVIAIGASTGGTRALLDVIGMLPADTPPVLIAQHMSAGFTLAFAKRLDEVSRLSVAEASGGEELRTGKAFLAPAGHHLSVSRIGGTLTVQVVRGKKVNHCIPSVDVLFRSMAMHVAEKGIGVLMTGMGNDGAKGLRAMRKAGAVTMAQDEASCVVYGMPRAAVELGAAQRVIDLHEIPGALISEFSGAMAR